MSRPPVALFVTLPAVAELVFPPQGPLSDVELLSKETSNCGATVNRPDGKVIVAELPEATAAALPDRTANGKAEPVVCGKRACNFVATAKDCPGQSIKGSVATAYVQPLAVTAMFIS
jgi:hypothetical protein